MDSRMVKIQRGSKQRSPKLATPLQRTEDAVASCNGIDHDSYLLPTHTGRVEAAGSAQVPLETRMPFCSPQALHHHPHTPTADTGRCSIKINESPCAGQLASSQKDG